MRTITIDDNVIDLEAVILVSKLFSDNSVELELNTGDGINIKYKLDESKLNKYELEFYKLGYEIPKVQELATEWHKNIQKAFIYYVNSKEDAVKRDSFTAGNSGEKNAKGVKGDSKAADG